MVKRNRWLDVTPQGSKATANRGIQVDQWLTGTVTEQVDSSNVAVELDGSDSTPVVAPAAAGITYIGARVRCLRDSTGKIVQVEAPLTLPDGVEVIAAGSTGQVIVTAQETATAAQTAVNETQQALDEARTELTSSMSALDRRVSEAESSLSESQDYIEHTVTPGLEQAQSDAESAASAAAQAVADGVVSVVTEYAVGSSETVAPTSGWSTSTPARTAGTFIWSRTTTTKGDGTATTSSPVLVTGNTGAAGAAGVSVSSVTPYYVLVGTGASAPAKPTTNPPSSSWTLTEPAYQSSTELYRCDLTVMSDGSWSWGAVSKVSSYTAASLAMNNAAELIVNGGFETGDLTGWTPSGNVTVTTKDTDGSVVPPSGTYQCRFGVGSISQTIACPPAGHKLRVSAMLTGSYARRTITLQFQFAGQDAQVIGSKTADPYTLISADLTVPAGAATAVVTVSGDTIYTRADDISVRDVTDVQQQAVTLTNLIDATAAGLVSVSTTAPDVSQVGRVWIIPSADGTKVVGMKISNGSAWSSYAMMVEDLMVVGEDGTIRLKNGVVSAPNIKATSDLWTKILAVAGNATIGGNLLVNGAVDASKITASSELWAKIATFAKVTTGMLIAGGAKITGALLADVIQLATRLVAGDPDGTRVEMNGDGITVYRQLPDGMTSEAIRLGISGTDYIGILNTDGDTLSSLDDQGNITGQTLTANQNIVMAGQDLAETLDMMPRGVIAMAGAAAFPASISNLRTSYGLTEIAFTAPSTGVRVIKVAASFLLRQWGKSTNVAVTYTTDGSRPNVGSPVLIRWTTPDTAGGTDFTVDFNTVTSIALTEGQTIRMLLMIAENGNDGNIAFVNSMNPRFWVEDIGPYTAFGGVINSGGGKLPDNSSATPEATTDPVKTYTKTYSSTGCQSYVGSGAKYAYNVGKAYQGAYGSNTGLHSLWIFPSVISDLSGATVNKVILRITNQHTVANAGGTARIQAHGNTSIPATYGGGTAIANVSFAKGQTKDIDVTSQAAAGLKSGGVRGFGLLASATSDYGYWSGDAKLIITYTK